MKQEKWVRYATEELAHLRDNGRSLTDWERLDHMEDEDIVIDDDSPEVDETFFKNIGQSAPVKHDQIVSVYLDEEIIRWFKNAAGLGYRNMINDVLKSYIEYHSTDN